MIDNHLQQAIEDCKKQTLETFLDETFKALRRNGYLKSDVLISIAKMLAKEDEDYYLIAQKIEEAATMLSKIG